jgi:hypothetical protein
VKYSHELEWRLGVRAKNERESYILKIGSIADISMITPVSSLQNRVIGLKDGGYNLLLS